MCIPEIELPPPQLGKRAKFVLFLFLKFELRHFRNNSNPECKEDELSEIKDDFTPICHLKTEFHLKMSMKPELPTYNDSFINFNIIENMQTQYSPGKSKFF